VRILGFIEFGAIILGIVGLVAGQLYGSAKGFNLGIFLVGFGIALGGLESVVTRQMGFRLTGDGGDAYAGAPALIWGLMVLLVGAAIMGLAYVRAENLLRPTMDFLVRNPVVLASAAGFLLAGTGLLVVLSPRRRSHWAWYLFVRAPQLLAGVALILAGLAVMGGGVWQRYDAPGFERASKPVYDGINRLLRL
jgi:hypothetical protein